MSTAVPASVPENGTTFSDLGLPPALEAAVADLGFTVPSAIQAQAIPALLAGRDIVGVAQTGTGKTAAFGLPLLASVDAAGAGVQAVRHAGLRRVQLVRDAPARARRRRRLRRRPVPAPAAGARPRRPGGRR